MPDPAYDYIIENGLESESDYPYVGSSDNCAYDSSKKISDLNVTSYVDVPKDDNDQLKAAVAQQPLSVGMDG